MNPGDLTSSPGPATAGPNIKAIEPVLRRRAIKIWGEISPKAPAPQGIELLTKVRLKSVVYKLNGVGMQGSAVIAKRCPEAVAAVERTIYEDILPRVSLPSLHYYGCVPEEEGQFCWLFIEDAGHEEYTPEIAEHQTLAARWLGILHTSAARVGHRTGLPDRGPNHYLVHLRVARETIQQNLTNPWLSAGDVRVLESTILQCNVLESIWGGLEDSRTWVPCTVVHGDFQPKNVRVRPLEDGIGIFPLDWEMAGWGTPAADIAECPDLAAYMSVVQPFWPNLTVKRLQRLLEFGTIYRLLAAVCWASYGLVYERAKRPMRYIRDYESALAALTRAGRWGS